MPRTKSFDPDRVLDRAMRAFWARGYEATSVEDLVAATGINRASLYGTFGDKHALFLKALEHYGEIGLLAGLALEDTDRPVPDVLRDLFDRLIARCLEMRGIGCLVTNTVCEFGTRDAAISESARRALARMENALDLLVRRGQERGEIAADESPRAIARFLLNTMQGMQVLAKVNPDARALSQIADRTLGTL
ncbi:TetR/AcrR family transcriptional regulator [Marivibrio halodurans]|uniref:TetR/AcrR family transcriptional regulator n=1 Tax=Marivibrio halodurans TaxID=2039722 RepID=A0A8J7V5G4_9PROT|nr:TetR/AcrR family transcriptional regulator [Marivibrio halodurans]MBP5858889.1 TetR/AcrR family transcriptional regulator [Marivibrio halodurans]